MKRQEKEARGGGVVSAEVQDVHSDDMEREVMAIIRADPRSGGANEELVAWTAPDPSVIAGVQTDVNSDFVGCIGVYVCCLPLVLAMLVLTPCILVEDIKERTFKRQQLRQASSYVYVMTSCEGRRAYVTVDLEAKSVVWLHSSLWGQRPPRLHKVAGQSWVKDKVQDGGQVLYVLRPDDDLGADARTDCCVAESRNAFNRNKLLQVWFLSEYSTSRLANEPHTVHFMEELARELNPEGTAAVQSAPGVTSMPSDSDLPTATTVLESGVRVRVCLEGGKVSMFVADTSDFDAFMEQVAAHLGLPLGTHMLAFVDVQGDRVELSPSGLHALERDEKVIVVVQP